MLKIESNDVGIATKGAESNNSVGALSNENRKSAYPLTPRAINIPSVEEIIEKYSSSEKHWDTLVSEMADTHWGEITNEPTSNSFPSLDDFHRLWVDAVESSDFASYVNDCASSIDNRNLVQAVMLLRVIFLLAHGHVNEVPDINATSGVKKYLETAFSEWAKMGFAMADESSVIVHAYAYVNAMMDYCNIHQA